jgi:hypothetical protein
MFDFKSAESLLPRGELELLIGSLPDSDSLEGIFAAKVHLLLSWAARQAALWEDCLFQAVYALKILGNLDLRIHKAGRNIEWAHGEAASLIAEVFLILNRPLDALIWCQLDAAHTPIYLSDKNVRRMRLLSAWAALESIGGSGAQKWHHGAQLAELLLLIHRGDARALPVLARIGMSWARRDLVERACRSERILCVQGNNWRPSHAWAICAVAQAMEIPSASEDPHEIPGNHWLAQAWHKRRFGTGIADWDCAMVRRDKLASLLRARRPGSWPVPDLPLPLTLTEIPEPSLDVSDSLAWLPI